MANSFFRELYSDVESGVVQASVPKGGYDVIVADARPRTESSLIFLTLQILNGPQEGKQTEVNLYFPREGDKPFARTMFLRKFNGFGSYTDVKAAFQAADGAPDLDSGFQHIAGSLIGKQVAAEIGLRTEGEYAGTNELSSTKPMGGVQQTAPATSADPAAVAQPQQQDGQVAAPTVAPF